jgi:single-stranded DNA-binding protein
MNHCIFSGYLLFDPSNGLESGEGTSVCNFQLVTYEYTRNKRGEKKRYPTTVTLQAFDSGADAIAKLGKKGMKMTIHASARENRERKFCDSDVVFRVNQFDFGCLDKE